MKRKTRKPRKRGAEKLAAARASPRTANPALALQTRKALLKHYHKRYRVFSR